MTYEIGSQSNDSAVGHFKNEENFSTEVVEHFSVFIVMLHHLVERNQLTNSNIIYINGFINIFKRKITLKSI